MLLSPTLSPPSLLSLTSCSCPTGHCHLRKSACPCWALQQSHTGAYDVSGFMYDAAGLLKKPGLPVFECGSLCGCGEECRNRVVSQGRKTRVMLKQTDKKGWGVFACERIPKGTFIGIYSGELLGHEESEERAIKYDQFGRTYLFDIDWWYIDAELDAKEARQKEAKEKEEKEGKLEKEQKSEKEMQEQLEQLEKAKQSLITALQETMNGAGTRAGDGNEQTPIIVDHDDPVPTRALALDPAPGSALASGPGSDPAPGSGSGFGFGSGSASGSAFNTIDKENANANVEEGNAKHKDKGRSHPKTSGGVSHSHSHSHSASANPDSSDSNSSDSDSDSSSSSDSSDSSSSSSSDRPRRRPSKYTIDAYHAGNFTRFLNHSCDPNAALTPVYIDVDEIERPLLTIFSKRDIHPHEEITFSYSGDPDVDDDDDDNGGGDLENKVHPPTPKRGKHAPKAKHTNTPRSLESPQNQNQNQKNHNNNNNKNQNQNQNQNQKNEKNQNTKKKKGKKGDARVHVDCECGAAKCKGTIWRP
ncbi:uncharacterized protein C8R40DRAFT_1128925 [Lentinula edodes]|uniref:uncharacterized protein n=1 Tax=Lentinula edodes TaxID=5353 RepID=UPI001E8E3BC4|nr:uncharacterized protein C8R40DRAFT_1128925 [Lentinula edodes]KAH7869790.1 hypothetical protein C8R40DRAFT_1128925 [Lentinula edodes]